MVGSPTYDCTDAEASDTNRYTARIAVKNKTQSHCSQGIEFGMGRVSGKCSCQPESLLVQTRRSKLTDGWGELVVCQIAQFSPVAR